MVTCYGQGEETLVSFIWSETLRSASRWAHFITRDFFFICPFIGSLLRLCRVIIFGPRTPSYIQPWFLGSMMKFWRGFRWRDVATPVFAYETGVTSMPNGAVEPFWFRRKVQDLLTTIEETDSKVGRHRIPLGGIRTALWWTLGRESPAYLSDLQGHFLFPTHPPGYVHLPLFGLGDQLGFYSQVGSLEIG
jgi:hypothetical protein